MLHQIDRKDVCEGMYVAGFGGSWFDHPFWRANFLLSSPKDVDRIRNSDVAHVLIDDAQGRGPPAPPPQETEPPANPRQKTRRKPRPASKQQEIAAQRNAERKKAVALASRSKDVMRGVFEDVSLGSAVHGPSVNKIVEEISQSVSANPHTLLGVTRLKNKDEYTYMHSVAVCALMVAVAQYLELDADEVRDLGLAGLLHDIGKMRVPGVILNKPGPLTDEEFSDVRSHPEHGHRMLNGSPGASETALDVCLHHHEKIDGSGYPFGLPAERISFAARMGAVCDVYDALTSDRAYKKAWSSEQALGQMWQWDGHFDKALLAALMQTLRTYPAGTLVRLRDDRLAVVLERQSGRLQMRGLAFYSATAKSRIEPERVVLGKQAGEAAICAVENPADWGFDNWGELAGQLVAQFAAEPA